MKKILFISVMLFSIFVGNAQNKEYPDPLIQGTIWFYKTCSESDHFALCNESLLRFDNHETTCALVFLEGEAPHII
jgi:hypothetical protein